MKTGLGIYQLLQASTAVTDLVGTRIFPALAAQEAAMPFITYEIMQITPSDEKDGPSTLDEVRVEVIAYAATYSVAADLGAKIRTALDRMALQGDGIAIQSIRFQDVQDEVLDAPRRFLQVHDYTVRQLADSTGSVYLGQPVTVTDGDGTQVEVAAGGSYVCIQNAPPAAGLPAAPAIVYQRPRIGVDSGSAYEGDEAWQWENGLLPYPADPENVLNIARAATSNDYDTDFKPFALLAEDNIFGNRYRWTNTAGNAGRRSTAGYSLPQFHYTDDWEGAVHGYVIDHLTGLAWTAYAVNPPNGTQSTSTINHSGQVYTRAGYTFESFANYAHGLNGETQFSMGGHTDWRIPTWAELATQFTGQFRTQSSFAWSVPSNAFDFAAQEHWYNTLGQTGQPPRVGLTMFSSSRWGSQIHVFGTYSMLQRTATSTFACCFVRNHF